MSGGLRDIGDGLAAMAHGLKYGDGVGVKVPSANGWMVEVHDSPVDSRGEEFGAVGPATVQRRADSLTKEPAVP